MRKLFSLLVIVLVSFYSAFSQAQPGSILSDSRKIHKPVPAIYPKPGSDLLRDKFRKTEPLLKAYIKSHAGESSARKLSKATAWNFTVGQTHSWWATNLDESDKINFYKDYLAPSTCRAVGNNCYIFVEDSIWANGYVNKTSVDSIRIAFETRTPGDASKGIFQLDTMYYGNPPDVDNDPKIIILILDIKDGFSGSGGYIAGYFYAQNEYPDSVVQHYDPNSHSNEAEIYYVDAYPANLKSSAGLTNACATTAHEFQHMIFYNYSNINNIEKLTFIDEGMSEAASKLCGYRLESPSQYYSNTNVNFLSWDLSDNVLQDYSRAALFSWYLVEQFGKSVTKAIVQNTYDSIACYNNAIQSSGFAFQFTDVLKNFALAAEINSTTYDPKYGFTAPITIKPAAASYFSAIVPVVRDTLKPFGTRYVKFTGGFSFSLLLNTNGTIEVKAIASGTSNIKVDNVRPGTAYLTDDLLTGYTNVVFAVTNLTNFDTPFTYSATGSGGNIVELKYDYTEPTGYLPGLQGDTVCVWFNGVTNGILDSVRVAIRRPGTMSGGIWEYTGSINPTPLGRKLASITAVMNQPAPTYPYPVPWPNWTSIDLRANKIDASKAFAVAFENQGDGTQMPRVMITESPLPSETTSLTYLADDARWYFLTSNAADDSVYTYLIRAYVTIDTTKGSSDTVSNSVLYVLEQNYPNPFNSSTIIKYEIPKDEPVKLKIYDLLGREVAILADGYQQAGIHTVALNASGLSSGVYFYRINAGTFSKTRKLVLIK